MPTLKSVAELVDIDSLRELATRSNFRLGEELVSAGNVAIVTFMPQEVVAKVGGGVRRTVTLHGTEKGLEWKCTCTNDPYLFCKHCVAVGIMTAEKSPKRKD